MLDKYLLIMLNIILGVLIISTCFYPEIKKLRKLF